mmetsp:Transcript_55568/g.126330  ORF Transcript_55568/g.126330 Transcript_55568/m.126330 type:complete len:158 (+) Transcript_55568:675-1148(+)
MPKEERFVVNVASDEYWKSVAKHTSLFGALVYTVKFPGPSVYAKQARGLFCRFMCDRAVKRPEELSGFAEWTRSAGSSAGGSAVYELAGPAPKKGDTVLTFSRTSAAATTTRRPASKASLKKPATKVPASTSPPPTLGGEDTSGNEKAPKRRRAGKR